MVDLPPCMFFCDGHAQASHNIAAVQHPPIDTQCYIKTLILKPLKYLFQLRVGLSRLRHHKKRHNFADTPSDLCLCKTGVEDTRHYLLSCPFYARHREVLLSSVENVVRDKNLDIDSTDLFLYGDPSLSTSENQTIICATLDLIDKTNRVAS